MHQIDLTNSKLRDLTALAGRIIPLLEAAHRSSNKDLISALDDLLGALYALTSAVEKGFEGKSGESDFDTVLTRAKHLANGQVRKDGNWMAGFHFNSAMLRISAVFARLPLALAGSHKNAATAYLAKTGNPWAYGDADKIRKEANRLKHDRDGVYMKREEALPTAFSAVKQLLVLAETLP